MLSLATRAILIGLATAVGFLQPGRTEFVRHSVLGKQARGASTLLAIPYTPGTTANANAHPHSRYSRTLLCTRCAGLASPEKELLAGNNDAEVH